MKNFLSKKSIAVSILNVDNLDAFLTQLKAIENKFKLNNIVVHFDVMDGSFVIQKGVDLSLIKTVKEYGFFVDVHLMCSHPKDDIKLALALGADNITIHYEINNLYEQLKFLKECREQYQKEGRKISVGLAIKPETDVIKIYNYLPYIDMVLLMSVQPGQGGQSYLETVNNKIKATVYMGKMVQIDGGINNITMLYPLDAGVRSFVVGSYLTKDLSLFEERLLLLEKELK